MEPSRSTSQILSTLMMETNAPDDRVFFAGGALRDAGLAVLVLFEEMVRFFPTFSDEISLTQSHRVIWHTFFVDWLSRCVVIS